MHRRGPLKRTLALVTPSLHEAVKQFAADRALTMPEAYADLIQMGAVRAGLARVMGRPATTKEIERATRRLGRVRARTRR